MDLDKIIQIVKAMNASGVGVEEITANLRTAGLSDEDLARVLEAAKPIASTREIHESVKETERKISTGEHLMPVTEKLEEQATETKKIGVKIDEINFNVEEQGEKLDKAASALAVHKKRLDEIHAGVTGVAERHEELHEKVATLEELTAEVQGLKEMMLELKPLLAALKDINQKILESNRDVLIRLKTK